MPTFLFIVNSSQSCKLDVGDVSLSNNMVLIFFSFLAEPKFTMDRDAVAKVAQQCNM